jgi:hypothetical protein
MKNKASQSVENSFDYVARLLACPAPRRTMLKRLGGALASGFLGTFSALGAPPAKTKCGNTYCSSGQTCFLRHTGEYLLRKHILFERTTMLH